MIFNLLSASSTGGGQLVTCTVSRGSLSSSIDYVQNGELKHLSFRIPNQTFQVDKNSIIVINTISGSGPEIRDMNGEIITTLTINLGAGAIGDIGAYFITNNFQIVFS